MPDIVPPGHKFTRFRIFIIVSLAITLALAGWSFGASESANHHVTTQSTHIENNQRQEARDREAAVLKNIEARRDDCNNNNELRQGLRIGVLMSERNTPLLLRFLPSLNTKQIISLIHKEDERQLKAYAALNCQAYALRAAPELSRTKITIQLQQREIEGLIHELQVTEKREHSARLITIGQRCELTQLVLANTTKPAIRAKLIASYKNCQKQLASVRANK